VSSALRPAIYLISVISDLAEAPVAPAGEDCTAGVMAEAPGDRTGRGYKNK
jgi:hypothetical protein